MRRYHIRKLNGTWWVLRYSSPAYPALDWEDAIAYVVWMLRAGA